MTTADDNIQVIRGALEVVNTRAFDRVGEFIAPGFVRHDLTGAYPGVDAAGVTDYLAEFLRGAPDLRVVVHDIFGAGDRVAVRLTLEGTHQGQLFGRPGTGRGFAINQLNFYRLEGGKIAETWQLVDIAGFMSQVGG